MTVAEVDDRFLEDVRDLIRAAQSWAPHSVTDAHQLLPAAKRERAWRRLRDALVPFDGAGRWNADKSPRLNDSDFAALLHLDPDNRLEDGPCRNPRCRLGLAHKGPCLDSSADPKATS